MRQGRRRSLSGHPHDLGLLHRLPLIHERPVIREREPRVTTVNTDLHFLDQRHCPPGNSKPTLIERHCVQRSICRGVENMSGGREPGLGAWKQRLHLASVEIQQTYLRRVDGLVLNGDESTLATWQDVHHTMRDTEVGSTDWFERPPRCRHSPHTPGTRAEVEHPVRRPVPIKNVHRARSDCPHRTTLEMQDLERLTRHETHRLAVR